MNFVNQFFSLFQDYTSSLSQNNPSEINDRNIPVVEQLPIEERRTSADARPGPTHIMPRIPTRIPKSPGFQSLSSYEFQTPESQSNPILVPGAPFRRQKGKLPGFNSPISSVSYSQVRLDFSQVNREKEMKDQQSHEQTPSTDELFSFSNSFSFYDQSTESFSFNNDSNESCSSNDSVIIREEDAKDSASSIAITSFCSQQDVVEFPCYNGKESDEEFEIDGIRSIMICKKCGEFRCLVAWNPIENASEEDVKRYTQKRYKFTKANRGTASTPRYTIYWHNTWERKTTLFPIMKSTLQEIMDTKPCSQITDLKAIQQMRTICICRRQYKDPINWFLY